MNWNLAELYYKDYFFENRYYFVEATRLNGIFLAKRPSGSRNWGLDLASLVVFIWLSQHFWVIQTLSLWNRSCGLQINKTNINNNIQHLFHILWYIYFTLVFLKRPKYRIIQKGYSKFITVTAIEQHSRPHKQRMVSLWWQKKRDVPVRNLLNIKKITDNK